MNQFGRCLDVKDAYEMAVTGEVKGEPIAKKKKDSASENKVVQTAPVIALTREDAKKRYQQERYRKLSQLVEDPADPIVKQPEVVRTLVLNYSDRTSSGSPLYGHRYIYFFGSDPEWVLGPYGHTAPDQLLPNIVE